MTQIADIVCLISTLSYITCNNHTYWMILHFPKATRSPLCINSINSSPFPKFTKEGFTNFTKDSRFNWSVLWLQCPFNDIKRLPPKNTICYIDPVFWILQCRNCCIVLNDILFAIKINAVKIKICEVRMRWYHLWWPSYLPSYWCAKQVLPTFLFDVHAIPLVLHLTYVLFSINKQEHRATLNQHRSR